MLRRALSPAVLLVLLDFMPLGAGSMHMSLPPGHACACSPDHQLLIFAGNTAEEMADEKANIEAAVDDASHKSPLHKH